MRQAGRGAGLSDGVVVQKHGLDRGKLGRGQLGGCTLFSRRFRFVKPYAPLRDSPQIRDSTLPSRWVGW